MNACLQMFITFQVSRVARRRQIEEMEKTKSRMVYSVVKVWPSLTREKFLLEELAWLLNTTPKGLQNKGKMAVRAMLNMLPEVVTHVSYIYIHAVHHVKRYMHP